MRVPQVESDNWVGGFYMEVYVDGWDVDKTITLDFHTPEIEFPKHACQNVRVVGYSETTVTLVVVQQRWICCESFGCALRGSRPERITFSCGVLGSPPPSPPPLPFPPPPPSPPRPRPPPPPSPPPPPRQVYPPSPPPPPIMRVTESGILDTGSYEVDPTAAALATSTFSTASTLPPPPPALALGNLTDSQNSYVGVGLLILAGVAYAYASSRNLLPWAKGAADAIPQASDVAKLVRAKPKKVDVRVEVLGEEEATLEVATKGLTTVAELGERLAEEMVTTLNIEDAFKLYYVDNEGDTMLVSAHTALRDLIYSELITAKVDDYALPAPTPPPAALKAPRSSARQGRAQPADGEGEGEGEGASDNLLARSGDRGGKKKKKRGGAPRAAPSWDS